MGDERESFLVLPASLLGRPMPVLDERRVGVLTEDTDDLADALGDGVAFGCTALA